MENLKKLRKQSGISLKILGKALGVSESTVSLYENNKRQPDNDMLRKIADYFNVSTDYLLGLSKSKNINSIFDIDGIFPIPEASKIPIIGTIACGKPITAIECADEYINVYNSVPADFALRCKGDSMINARICDGDIVFIRAQPTVENGEIAAVLISNEVTLKKFYKLPDYIELRAENPRYSPILIPKKDDEEIRILGKVVAFYSAMLWIYIYTLSMYNYRF